ncbi:MAG: ATP synthase F1 subunit gamma [Candidatus Sungbacteria bacterium]|nr:ATP synthase F1 subunit gamma [Candidatus Sungbacteria bacterium]
MASLKDIKRRIRSVKNTSQITKAMEVVSATKMRRSQGIALSGRPYALAALDILKNVTARISEKPAILQQREVKNTLVLVITSDKGLAGAFNSNVLRLYERWLKENRENKASVVTVGKKARDYFLTRGVKTVSAFTGFGDYVSRSETEPLAEFLLHGYMIHDWDRVLLFYTNFRSTLKQEAKMIEVLPVNPGKIEETIRGITPEYGLYASGVNSKFKIQNSKFVYEYKFEPSPKEVLEKLLPTLFKIQLHHIILESNASEHSARMVAMKNASENAKELIGELTIEYNKSRQANITRELTEITAGKEALES